MSPIYVMIDPTATGNRIRELMDKNDVTVSDLQEACGFERPQAVYKWLSGKSLPAMDNMVILREVLHTSIDNILVTNEDVFIFGNPHAAQRLTTRSLYLENDCMYCIIKSEAG